MRLKRPTEEANKKANTPTLTINSTKATSTDSAKRMLMGISLFKVPVLSSEMKTITAIPALKIAITATIVNSSSKKCTCPSCQHEDGLQARIISIRLAWLARTVMISILRENTLLDE